MTTFNKFTSSLVCLCTLLACSDDTASSMDTSDGEDATSEATETSGESQGEGDGDPGDGDPGDGDGDPGDGDGDPMPDMGMQPDPNEMIPPPDEEGCHGIYAQDLLPTFEVDVHPLVWDELQWEWNNGQANEDDPNVDPNPYHPVIEFRYQDIVILDAKIRLRGNPTHWDPLPGDKMQFQIGFHTNDPEGHFLGLKRLALDAATYNRHMLRDRLSLSIMRSVGIAAPCANHARLVINGEYYGVFTNIEKLDEVFLVRAFDDPTGDLWKRANWELKTNLETANDDRLDAMRDVTTIEELETYLDFEQSLRVNAAEAVIPDSDGLWAGGLNFYLYDEPIGGKFMLLPWDLDNTFERFNDEPDGEYPVNPDPIVWEKLTSHGRPWYDLMIAEPVWHDYYIDLIDEIVAQGYDPQVLHEKIDTYTAQIQQAVYEDVNKPYSNQLYDNKVEELHEYVDTRHAFLVQWLDCWKNGGTADGDGYCVP